MSTKFDILPKTEVPLPLYALIVFLICVCPIVAILSIDGFLARTREAHPRGCRKLGLGIRSHLADEYHTQYERGSPYGKRADGSGRWRVKSLWIYPVKSCTGVELQRGMVVGTGMQYDRQFSFAYRKSPTARETDTGNSESPPQWGFLTQRQYPLMSQIKTEIWVPDPSSPTYSSKAADVQSGGVIVITFPLPARSTSGWMTKACRWLTYASPTQSFRVPFMPSALQIQANGYTTERMTIWDDSPKALNMSMHVPPQLGEFLRVKKELGLFRIVPGKEREVFRCAPKKEEIGWQPVTGFSDAYPLHMQNLASVRDVSNKQPKGSPSLSARRFRPNIIVDGPPPYTEDAWKKIQIGAGVFFVVCRTARCRLPNIDPETGNRHAVEPDRTLKEFRRIDQGAKGYACLGMQMVPAIDSEQVIQVGDAIDVLETGDHFYLE